MTFILFLEQNKVLKNLKKTFTRWSFMDLFSEKKMNLATWTLNLLIQNQNLNSGVEMKVCLAAEGNITGTQDTYSYPQLKRLLFQSLQKSQTKHCFTVQLIFQTFQMLLRMISIISQRSLTSFQMSAAFFKLTSKEFICTCIFEIITHK